jgi:hypothetical protein
MNATDKSAAACYLCHQSKSSVYHPRKMATCFVPKGKKVANEEKNKNKKRQVPSLRQSEPSIWRVVLSMKTTLQHPKNRCQNTSNSKMCAIVCCLDRKCDDACQKR